MNHGREAASRLVVSHGRGLSSGREVSHGSGWVSGEWQNSRGGAGEQGANLGRKQAGRGELWLGRLLPIVLELPSHSE